MQKTYVVGIDLHNFDTVDNRSFFEDHPIDHGAALGRVFIPNDS